MKNFFNKKQKGFAMLFTVLVVTLILSIAISISNITFKQAILSGLAKDSQISFFEADSAVECGLYYDVTTNSGSGYFPEPSLRDDINQNIQNITCGGKTLVLDYTNSLDDYFLYNESNPSNTPCFSVLFDKTGTQNLIQGIGYNTCISGPRQVQRILETRY